MNFSAAFIDRDMINLYYLLSYSLMDVVIFVFISFSPNLRFLTKKRESKLQYCGTSLNFGFPYYYLQPPPKKKK